MFINKSMLLADLAAISQIMVGSAKPGSCHPALQPFLVGGISAPEACDQPLAIGEPAECTGFGDAH